MIKVLRWLTRISGLCALALGTILWVAPGMLGIFAAALQVHMTLGGIMVLALAILAVWALIDRVRIPAAVVGLVWAAATVLVGTLQDWWVAGGGHFGIALIHPLLGIGAIGLAEMLAAALTRSKLIRKRASLA